MYRNIKHFLVIVVITLLGTLLSGFQMPKSTDNDVGKTTIVCQNVDLQFAVVPACEIESQYIMDNMERMCRAVNQDAEMQDMFIVSNTQSVQIPENSYFVPGSPKDVMYHQNKPPTIRRL